MIKNEWTTEEVLQDITKQLENKEKNIDLLRTRIRSKIRRIEKLCTSNKKLHEENERLKENIHSILFTDDVVQDRYDKAKRENEELKLLVAEAWAYFKASLPCLYRHWIEKADKFLGEDK